MPELNKITVDPDGATLAVTITGHGSITAYTTRAGTVSVSFPESISAPTDYWLSEAGDFTVVGTINGEEVVRQTVGVADAEGTNTPVVRLSTASMTLGALVSAISSGGGGDSLLSWTQVFDLNDEADLTDFTEGGDGTWTFAGHVIAQTAAGATAATLTLLFDDLLDGMGDPMAIRVAWEARITDALAASEAVAVAGVGRGMQFNDDGTIDDYGVGDSAAVVLNQWYSVMVRTGQLLAESGGVAGLTTDIDPYVYSVVADGLQAFPVSQRDQFIIDVTGGVRVQVRNLAVHVLEAADPA